MSVPELPRDESRLIAAAAGVNLAQAVNNFDQPHVRREPAAAGRTGWLRHGNPVGDLLAVAQCGARTRIGGACRQPAMANGRCRLHGGKSTGPRTVAGLANSHRSRFAHGRRAAWIRWFDAVHAGQPAGQPAPPFLDGPRSCDRPHVRRTANGY